MPYFILVRIVFAVAMCFGMSAWADDAVGTMNRPGNAAPAQAEDADEKAYRMEMMRISDAITQKITEIEEKQKQIDSEIYPASKPPLEAEKAALQQQLQILEMKRDQLKAKKESKDMSKSLQNSSQGNAAPVPGNAAQ